MADGRHLEKSKTAISPQRLDRFAQNLAWWCILALRRARAIKILNFLKSNMADSRHLEKFNKRPYVWNGLTDLHEIWHSGANWHCKGVLAVRISNFWKSPFFPSPSIPPSFSLPSSLFLFTHNPSQPFPFFYPPLPHFFFPSILPSLPLKVGPVKFS